MTSIVAAAPQAERQLAGSFLWMYKKVGAGQRRRQMIASRLDLLAVKGAQTRFRFLPSLLVSRDLGLIDQDVRHLQPALRKRLTLQDRLRRDVNGKIRLREEIPRYDCGDRSASKIVADFLRAFIGCQRSRDFVVFEDLRDILLALFAGIEISEGLWRLAYRLIP